MTITIDGLLKTGAAAGAIMAVMTLTLLGLRVIYQIVEPHFVRAITDIVTPHMDRVEAELKPNAGQSLKDVTNRTASDLIDLRDRFVSYEAYQHKRNHEFINKQAVILTAIKLLHSDEVRDLGLEDLGDSVDEDE